MEKLTAFVILAIVAAVIYVTQVLGGVLLDNGSLLATVPTRPPNTATLEYSGNDARLRLDVPLPAVPSIGK